MLLMQCKTNNYALLVNEQSQRLKIENFKNKRMDQTQKTEPKLLK